MPKVKPHLNDRNSCAWLDGGGLFIDPKRGIYIPLTIYKQAEKQSFDRCSQSLHDTNSASVAHRKSNHIIGTDRPPEGMKQRPLFYPLILFEGI